MKSLLAKKWVVVSLLGGAGLAFLATQLIERGAQRSTEAVPVARRDIVQEVSVTGSVRPASEVSLAFERAGKVRQVFVGVGAPVVAGQLLATQEAGELQADLAGAQAALEGEEAKLSELVRGTRQEELDLEKSKVEKNRTAIEDARKTLLDKLREAYTKSDDAIRNRADQLFADPQSAPKLKLLTVDAGVTTSLESDRLYVEDLLKRWKAELDVATHAGDLDALSVKAKSNTSFVSGFLTRLSMAVNGVSPTSSLPQSTIDSYRSSVSAARSDVNTAITNLTAAEEKLKTAESDLLLAERSLAIKQSGATPEAISVQEAQVRRSRADVQSVIARLAKASLRSPIAGVVVMQDAKVGAVALAGADVISIISKSKFKIEANVPEADIAKIKVGDPARLTLDAYGDERFRAKVIAIDPGETVIEGVTTYKTTLEFENEDSRIRPSMTANLDIETARRGNVLAILRRAVATKNGTNVVRVARSDGSEEEREVKTGISSQEGFVEILSGLRDGDRVLIGISARP